VEGKEKEKEGTNIRGVFRTSPLSTSILVGLRKDGWEGRDQAYVHLIEGSSQPYKTQFMNTPLQGIFCLNYGRLGVFENIGDKIELDNDTIKQFLADKKIHLLEEESKKAEYFVLEKSTVNVQGKERDKKTGKIIKQKEVFKQKKQHGQVYEIANAAETRKERASQLIKALAVLRGGSKQAAFATDVSPKVLILAGLTCGNPIFNNLFEDKIKSKDNSDSSKEAEEEREKEDKDKNKNNNFSNRGKTVIINIEALKEIVTDYKDRICTPVFIGIRTGYIQNEDEVRSLESNTNNNDIDGIRFVVTTPISAAQQMAQALEEEGKDEMMK
jgi:CRISPR-associated protein Cst2